MQFVGTLSTNYDRSVDQRRRPPCDLVDKLVGDTKQWHRSRNQLENLVSNFAVIIYSEMSTRLRIYLHYHSKITARKIQTRSISIMLIREHWFWFRQLQIRLAPSLGEWLRKIVWPVGHCRVETAVHFAFFWRDLIRDSTEWIVASIATGNLLTSRYIQSNVLLSFLQLLKWEHLIYSKS